MSRTDDPIQDFLRHDAKEQAWLDKRPKCSCCDEPIQDDYLFDINDELICEACLNHYHKKHTENYID